MITAVQNKSKKEIPDILT